MILQAHFDHPAGPGDSLEDRPACSCTHTGWPSAALPMARPEVEMLNPSPV